MSITAECSACGRRYEAPAGLAGKRVRCKQCGNIFELPSIEPMDAGPDLDALAELERSHHSLDGALAATGSHPSDNTDAAEGETDAAEELPRYSGRTNVRFRYAYARELDAYLPMVLTVGGLLWLALATVRCNPSGEVWIAVLRIVLAVLAYAVFIAPLTLAAIRRAGRSLGYQMPLADRWRAFAAYLPAFVFGLVLWLMGNGWMPALILGCLAGVTVSTATLWLFFRLRPAEIAPSAAYASVGFFIGLAIAGAVVWGLNTLTINILVAIKQPDAIPASPFGPGFAWVTPEQKQAIVAKNPPPKPPQTPPVEPAPQPAAPGPAEVAGIAPAIPEAPAPEVVAPPPVAPEPISAAPRPVVITSPIVKSADPAPIAATFDNVIRPLTDSPFIATLRNTDGNSTAIELWDTDTWIRKGSAVFAEVPGTRTRYVLSPDGENLARIATFPRLSAQIWSFLENRVTRTINLDERLGAPELVGFAGNRRLLVRWQRDQLCGLEVTDISTGERIRQIDTPLFEHTGYTLAVSSSGQLAAIAAKVENYPTLLVYNLESGRVLTRVRITSLDPRWPVTPTGMSFSPDASKLAVLFEQAGNGLLLCYRLDRGQQIAEHVYPAGPLPGRDTRQFSGSALAWLPDGKSWLLYGQAVFDIKTGQMVADLGLGDVETSRVMGPDIVEIVTPVQTDAASKQKSITQLRLDMAKVSNLVEEPMNQR